MTGRVPAIALAAAVAIAGCAAARPSASGPVATASVDLPASYRFAPADVAVATGTTVTWTNNDHFTHSVQFTDGGLPAEPMLMEPGATASFTFDRAGTFRYQCHLHPQDMTGSVTVGP